jgi:hypothetical protein
LIEVSERQAAMAASLMQSASLEVESAVDEDDHDTTTVLIGRRRP